MTRHPFIRMILAATTTGLLAALASAQGVSPDTVEQLVNEVPVVTDIDAEATAPLREELARQIDRILDRGPLAPLRMAYADIPYEAYWLYYERGRILNTLGRAWPYLDEKRQDAVRDYVRKLLADEAHQPWQPGIMDKTDGATRAYDGELITEGRYPDAKTSPTLHVLYGLWLYADRSGEWDLIEPHWPAIKAFYAGSGRMVRLYGQIGAHIAIARMAEHFDDTPMIKAATAALMADLLAAQDLDAMESTVKEKTRWRVFYERRPAAHFPGQPWMILDACPEILRFIAGQDELKKAILGRVKKFTQQYPQWWMMASPYFTRWTGDEGIGLAADVFGLVVPVHRWLERTPPAKMAVWMRSAPTGIGDCYWLEALVDSIEAYGKTTWQARP